MDENFGHTPVLPRQVCELLAVRKGDIVLDATVGLAGHAAMFAESLGEGGSLIGLDVDPGNLEIAGRRLSTAAAKVSLVRANFGEVASILESANVPAVDVLFADLGMSSTQLDDAERGFSFQRDGPLDMRLDSRLTYTATDLVNSLKEKALGDLLYFNAQETASRRIARRICLVRREGRITTTGQLSGIVLKVLGGGSARGRSKIHPATRTFLALRMAVNEEIPRLEQLLAVAPDILKPGGRIGLIAFHSVEDRPIKHDFRRRKADGIYEIVTKKPVVADSEERQANPRARSAKLRVATRL